MKSNEIIGLTVLICIVCNITNYNCKILGIRATPSLIFLQLHSPAFPLRLYGAVYALP